MVASQKPARTENYIQRPPWLVVVFALISLIPAALFAQAKPKAKQRPAHVASSPAPDPLADAEAAIVKKDFYRAEELLLAATKKDSKDHRAWYDLGFIYRATNRMQAAVEAYQRSLALKPDEAQTNLSVGEVLVALDRRSEAVPYLSKAVKLKPGAASWILLGQALETADPNGAVQAYRSAIAAAPKELEPLLRLAAVFDTQKNYSEAEAAYKSAIAIEPKSAEAVAGLANVYIATNRHADAESALRQYLQLDPGNPQARIQLGRLLAKSGKVDEAIAELEGVGGTNPDASVIRELAELYFEAKRYDKALVAYDALLPAMQNDAQVHYGRGNTLLRLTRYAEAEAALVNALKLDPKMTEGYADLALAASNNKHYELAIRALDTRASLTPDNPATYFLRATCYDNLRIYKEAAKNYKLFLEAAGGRFADQEWQARHRLIAIEPKGNR